MDPKFKIEKKIYIIKKKTSSNKFYMDQNMCFFNKGNLDLDIIC